MKQLALIAINKVSGEIDHVCTSDGGPIGVNPFAHMSDTHDFEEYEFDNTDENMVRGREFLDSVERQGQAIVRKAGAAANRIAGLSRKPVQ